MYENLFVPYDLSDFSTRKLKKIEKEITIFLKSVKPARCMSKTSTITFCTKMLYEIREELKRR